MACIEHYVKDAENIFNDIKIKQKYANDRSYAEYVAVRTIQRWFRGYITRKFMKYLNSCAVIIQKNWRGHIGRKYYSVLLKDSVHKLYLDYFNLTATKIQKVWRGHDVRKHVFSFYKLKEYVNGILEKNKEFLEQAKEYEVYTQKVRQRDMQKECEEWLAYLSFRIHHLIRTHQIEGIYSNHGTFQYSVIEKHLKMIKFTDYISMKHAETKSKELKKPDHSYIFKGRLRECEEAWIGRNDFGKYSLATGEYGLDLLQYKQREKTKDMLLRIQDKPMKFGPVRYNDNGTDLEASNFKCPPLHRTRKPVEE